MPALSLPRGASGGESTWPNAVHRPCLSYERPVGRHDWGAAKPRQQQAGARRFLGGYHAWKHGIGQASLFAPARVLRQPQRGHCPCPNRECSGPQHPCCWRRGC